MNKFLKGAIAGALVAPCMLGLAGCGKTKDEDKSAEIYSSIYEQVSSLATPFQSITTPGGEAQLTINVKIDYKSIVAGIADAQTSVTANLRAVIGARHNNNKEIFGNIGFVDTQNNFTSLLSAYAVDDVDTNATVDTDEEYTPVGKILESDWELFKGLVYVEDSGTYVPASETYNSEANYYMMTKDLLHIYLNCNMSAIDEYIGFNISDQLPIGDGKIYATLNMGSEIPDTTPDIEDSDEDSALFDMDEILDTIKDLEEYDSFKATAEESGLTISSDYKKDGDSSLTLSAEGVTIKFVVKADGNLSIVLNSQQDNGMQKDDITVTIDFIADDEVDATYIPSDLSEYGEDPQDFKAVVSELASQFMPVE